MYFLSIHPLIYLYLNRVCSCFQSVQYVDFRIFIYFNIEIKLIFTLTFPILFLLLFPLLILWHCFPVGYHGNKAQCCIVLQALFFSGSAQIRKCSIPLFLHSTLLFHNPLPRPLSVCFDFSLPRERSRCLISTQPVCRVQHALIHTQSNVKHIIAHTFSMTDCLSLIISASAAAEGRCLQ